jgi:hypothetical protein
MRENQLIMNDFMLYDNLFKDNVCDILKEHTDAKINYSKYIYCESFESAIIIYRKKMTRNYLVVMLSRFIKSNKINISTKRYYNIKYIAHLLFGENISEYKSCDVNINNQEDIIFRFYKD